MTEEIQWVIDIYGRKLYPMSQQNLSDVELAREIEKARSSVRGKNDETSRPSGAN